MVSDDCEFMQNLVEKSTFLFHEIFNFSFRKNLTRISTKIIKKRKIGLAFLKSCVFKQNEIFVFENKFTH